MLIVEPFEKRQLRIMMSEADSPDGVNCSKSRDDLSLEERGRRLSGMLDFQQPARYLLRVVGKGLVEQGIFDGDALIADASFEPVSGRVSLVVNGRKLPAWLSYQYGGWCIWPEKATPPPGPRPDPVIWAFVRGVIRVTI